MIRYNPDFTTTEYSNVAVSPFIINDKDGQFEVKWMPVYVEAINRLENKSVFETVDRMRKNIEASLSKHAKTRNVDEITKTVIDSVNKELSMDVSDDGYLNPKFVTKFFEKLGLVL